MAEEQKILALSGNFTARFIHRTTKNPRELLLLLHGYSLSGENIYKKISPLLTENCVVVAPNGPFPVPEPVGKSYRLGFSWYFYDPQTDEYYIDMKLALHYLEALVNELNLASLPKRIIGYSQGGYLAPFAAQHLLQVTQVIGVNCQFLDEEISGLPPCPMDAVQGAKDEVVDPAKARRSFEKLKARGLQGQFISVPDAGHGLSPPILKAVQKLLEEPSCVKK